MATTEAPDLPNRRPIAPVIERTGSPTGRAPMRREVHPRLLINWAAVATCTFTGFLMFLLGMATGISLIENLVTR